MRVLYFAGLLLSLAACDDPEIDFARPFPPSAASLTAFPARHQGVYIPGADSSQRLFVTAQVVYEELFSSRQVATRLLDSLQIPAAGRVSGQWYPHPQGRYRLRPVQPEPADSVWLDRWVPDTLCNLRPGGRSVARWFKGAYYLNEPLTFFMSPDRWHVQRLVMSGRQMRLEYLARDTAGLAALPPGVAVRTTQTGRTYWLLNPVTPRQERQIARRDDLWETQLLLDTR